MPVFIKNFDQLNKSNTQIAGGKGASLGEMTQAGIPVPPGFVILSEAFEFFLEQTGLNVEIQAVLDTVNNEEIHTVEHASEKIKALILNSQTPGDVTKEIKKNYNNLNAEFVAVRSSATAEDSSSAAWAGQLESYLNTTEENLLENVKKCWASLFTPRAIFYRFEKKLHNQKISVAVVVQKMIQSEVSGIAFSVHPVTEDYNQLIIEASYGLGEAIVSGQVTPDSYVAEKNSGKIIEKMIQEKTRGLFKKQNSANEWVDIPQEKANMQALTDKQIHELAELIIKIENHYSFPVDIEWALAESPEPAEGKKFFIVQSRPITTLSNKIISRKKFNKDDYLLAFWAQGVSVFVTDIHAEIYRNLEALFIIDQAMFKQYFSNNAYKRALDNGVKFYADKVAYENYENKLKKLCQDFKLFFELKIKNKVNISRKDVIKFFEFTKKLCGDYTKMNFEFTDKAFIEQKNNLIIKKNLEKASKFKDFVRAEMNIALFEPEGYSYKLFNILSKQFNLDVQTIENMTQNEILNLFENKMPDQNIIKKRQRSFAEGFGLDSPQEGSAAEELILEFKEDNAQRDKIYGQTANKGFYKGSVKIIPVDYGDLQRINKEIEKMKNGEILVAETTAPEVIVACKKAGAIITDMGGLMSHAAIVSREFGIPCVVGTKNASKILRDGDLVEVDASAGIVRILEKAGASHNNKNLKNKKILANPQIEQNSDSAALAGVITVLEKEKKSREAHDKEAKLAISKPGSSYEPRDKQGALTDDFIIPRVREYAMNPVYWNAVLQTSSEVEKIYGKTLNIEYNFFFNGRMNTIIPKKEWVETGEYIADKLINENGYFEKIQTSTESAKKKIISFLNDIKDKDFSKFSFHNLIDYAHIIYFLFIEYDAASVFAWFVAGDTLKQKIGQCLNISDDELDIIALPEKQTIASQMEREIIESSLSTSFNGKDLKRLVEKYYWIPFAYDGPSIWDDKHFMNRISEYQKNKNETKFKLEEIINRHNEFKEKSKKIIQNSNIGIKEKKLIRILETIAIWTDERKMLEFQLFFQYYRILSEFEKRFNFPVTKLKYLFNNEYVGLEKNSSKLKKVAEKRFKKEFMTITENGNIRIATNEELEKIKVVINQQAHSGTIKGTVACRGPKDKYIAEVKVLLSSKECPKVKHGEILIASMTTPDYVPAMNRALGFITDEGGVTCHAAIVAREMNKPCIIGTKIATQVLKDGDLIEVDAKAGVVKILKTNNSKTKNIDKKFSNINQNFPVKNKYPIGIDWFLLIERPQPFFLTACFVNAWGDLAEQVTGFGSKHQLYLLDQKTMYVFRSKKEWDKLIEYFFDILQNKPDKLNSWISDGLEHINWLDNTFNIFTKSINKKQLISEYPALIKKFTKHLLLNALISRWVLSSIETKIADNKKITKYKSFIEPLEKIRNQTKFLEFMEKVMPKYFDIASDISGHRSLMEYLTPEELWKVINGEKIDFNLIAKRKECIFWVSENNQISFSYDRKLAALFMPSDPDTNQDLKGKIACKGKAKGLVSIINTPKEIIKMKQGNILVSINTNPALMPAIQKASAIVTDEGGMACHAAIVSRELNIPCIVGTKFATRSLRDGYLVEVDANEGTVRILKKYES